MCVNGFQIFNLPYTRENIKFLHASLKTLTNSKTCSEISVLAFIALIGQFSPVYSTFMASFRNNFQDQRRLSEQLLESQAAIGKPEEASFHN
jgi:hypothetical protein